MRFLYRYYSCFDFVLDTIINKRIYFPSPNDFNDPFDCCPKFSLLRCKKDNEKDWKSYLFFLAKDQYPGISDDEALKHAEAAIQKGLHRDKEWLFESDKSISKALNEKRKDVRICSFSKSPRNQMMWAHYANNHQGIVLQFSSVYMFDAVSGTFRGFDVDYYSKPITLRCYVESIENSLKGDNLAFVRLIYCSKSYEWTHEEEVRFFSKNIYMPYPEEMLKGILLGSECPSHWEDMIYKAVSTWRSKPKIFKEDAQRSSIKIYFRLVNRKH